MAWCLACNRKIGSTNLAGALLIPYTCCQVVIVIERIDYNCILVLAIILLGAGVN
jgi:hypothetical protein